MRMQAVDFNPRAYAIHEDPFRFTRSYANRRRCIVVEAYLQFINAFAWSPRKAARA